MPQKSSWPPLTLAAHAHQLLVVFDPKGASPKAFHVRGMPTSFVINRAGKVHSVHNGFLGEATRKQYIQEIEQLLSAKP